jgi:hypothetical protein
MQGSDYNAVGQLFFEKEDVEKEIVKTMMQHPSSFFKLTKANKTYNGVKIASVYSLFIIDFKEDEE